MTEKVFFNIAPLEKEHDAFFNTTSTKPCQYLLTRSLLTRRKDP